MRLTFLLIVFLLVFCSPNYAAIYKWVNEQGFTSFTQQPPKNKSIPFKKIKVKTTPPIDGYDEETIRAKMDAQKTKSEELSLKQAQKDAKQKQVKAGSEELKKHCAIAKKSLANLNQGGNRLYKDADGSYLRLDEESKDQKRQEITQFLTDNCQ